MTGLAACRPVFHSEADFQHALAMFIHDSEPATRVRLEYRPYPAERLSVDMWLVSANEIVAVELKYLTRALECTFGNEVFSLRNQAAQDISRYDVIKDLTRLERMVTDGKAHSGVQITLTNDPGYWRESRRDTVDRAFRIHEGRDLHGALEWSPSAGRGTTRGREQPLTLTGSYRVAWHPFSVVGPTGPGEFRYALFALAGGRTSSTAS